MSKGEVAFMLLWVILAVFTFVYSFTLPLMAMILELMFSCINIVASTLFIITWIKQLVMTFGHTPIHRGVINIVASIRNNQTSFGLFGLPYCDPSA